MDGLERYMVCTRCATYNHESFIKDALCGFVMQETSFPFVSVIVDDASTDGTARVIDCFLREQFDFSDKSVAYRRETDFGQVVFARHRDNTNCFFVVFFLKENHYIQGKSKNSYFEEWMNVSRYVAFCEGDDYWIDPLKLQRQVGILEQMNDVSLCCSKCAVSTTNNLYHEQRYPTECIVPTTDIILGGGLWLHTATYVFRNNLKDNYPCFCANCHVGDFPLILWASLTGSVYYLPKETAVYRFQSPGSWTQRQKTQSIDKLIEGWRSEVDMLEGLNTWSNQKYSTAFHKRIAFFLYDQMLLRKPYIGLIASAFKDEMRYFSRKQKAHILFARIHLESLFLFLLKVWHRIKRWFR